MDYKTPVNDNILGVVVEKLKENGFIVTTAEDRSDAKEIVEGMLKEGSSVMTMSSVTLDETGILQLVNDSGKYDSVKNKLYSDSG